MSRQIQNFINGESVPSSSGTTQELINPSTGEVFATAPVSNADDVDAAFSAASTAFKDWRDSTPGERQAALLAIADIFEQHKDELVELEGENTGKAEAVTMGEEIPPMLDQIRFFAGAARVLEGRSTGEYMKGFTSMIRREPVGGLGQGAPWN